MKKESASAKRIPQKWLLALLLGITLGFTFFFFGAVDFYAGNMAEFNFRFSSFAPGMALIALCVAAVVTVFFLCMPRAVFYPLYGLAVGGTVMGYAQGTFLNIGMKNLATDGLTEGVSAGKIGNLILWAVVVLGATLVFSLVRNKALLKNISLFVLAAVFGMQLAGFAANMVTVSTDDSKTGERYFLSQDGIHTLSEKNNVVIFILDRFDDKYYRQMSEESPEVVDCLTDFVHYTDNLSSYPATYPAVCHMITGIKNDYTETREAYFRRAYQMSPFLQCLKEEGYRIKLYTDYYYAYASGRELISVADNVVLADETKPCGYMMYRMVVDIMFW